MTSFTLAVEGYKPYTGILELPALDPQAVSLWQHKDDVGVWGAPRGCAPCPAVFPMNEANVTVTRDWQFFIRAINYNMPLQYVAALFGPKKAFCNRDVDDLRADWLRGRDLDRPDPEFDKVRTCALSVMSGYVEGSELVVSMLDGSRPPPLKAGAVYPSRVEDIRPEDYLYTPWTHRHLFFAANITNLRGETVPFANGALYDYFGTRPVSWLPHVSKVEVRYTLANLAKLPEGALPPSPYKP